MQDDKCDYCLLSGHEHFLEWPAGAVKPKWTGTGCEDVFGCGLVLSVDNKLAIFFTTNGTLMGKLFHKNTRQIYLFLYPLLLNTAYSHLGMEWGISEK
jgi:hypothetical protein